MKNLAKWFLTKSGWAAFANQGGETLNKQLEIIVCGSK